MGLKQELKEGFYALGKDYGIKPNFKEGSKRFARTMGYNVPKPKVMKKKKKSRVRVKYIIVRK